MDVKLCERYLAGIISNKGEVERSYLPRVLKFEDDRYNVIASAIVSLVDDGSSMSDLVVIDSVRSQFLAVAEGADWDDEKDWYESFVYASTEMDISPVEIEELYNILQRQRLSDQTRKILATLASRVDFDEDGIDEALEKLRLIKAVYPSKSAKLDEQSSSAVHDALNNSTGIIPYGFKSIDDEMGGVCRKEITIIAGRPSHGKTSLICQFVLNWIQNGYKVLFISKEMPIARLMHKFFSNIGNIPSDDIKRGVVEDPEYLGSIADAFVAKYRDKLFMYDNVYSSAEIERLILKHKPDIVIDDFIQLSDFGKYDARIGIAQTLKHYKSLGKENNVAFIVVSQLSRSIEGRDDPVPRMSDLSESGYLEQLAADVCFIFYGYKITYNIATKNRVEFIIAKARYGESTSIPLGFDGKMMRYYAIPKFSSGA